MGMIRTTERFQRDMMLMFTNALMYNNSDQDIYQMAMEMYKDVMVHIEVHKLVHISHLLLRLSCMCSMPAAQEVEVRKSHDGQRSRG